MNFRNFYHSYMFAIKINTDSTTVTLSSLIQILITVSSFVLFLGIKPFSFYLWFVFVSHFYLLSSRRERFNNRPNLHSTSPMSIGRWIANSYLILLFLYALIVFFTIIMSIGVYIGLGENRDDWAISSSFDIFSLNEISLYHLIILLALMLLIMPLSFIRKGKNHKIGLGCVFIISIGYNFLSRICFGLKLGTSIIKYDEILSLENPNSVFMPALIFLGISVVISFAFNTFIVNKTKQRKYI